MSACNKPTVNVRFVNRDIATVSVDAVVTGEDPDLEIHSFVTTSLIKAFPKFRSIREELKRKQRKGLKFGQVLSSFLGEPRSARNQANFRYVLHAVLDVTVIDKNSADWVIKNMGYLYGNIFQASEDLKLHSVALPLLGTGASQIDSSPAIEALAKSIVNTYFVSLTDLMVVCIDEVFLNRAKQLLVFEWQSKTKGTFHRLLIDGQPIETMESQADRDLSTSRQNIPVKTVPTSTGPGKTNNTYNDTANSCMSTIWYVELTQDISVDPQIPDELYARSLQNKEESRSGQSVEEEYRKLARTDEDQRHQEDSLTPVIQQDKKSSTFKDDGQEETCSICLNTISNPKKLDKCGHVFCIDCIDRSFQEYKPVCPSCNMVYGEIRGNQPDGQMEHAFSGDHLPGYEGHGTITITYSFPRGIQQQDHPSPGKPYSGTTRRAYLPRNKEGTKILALLREAFDRKLTFTIGRSTTTGRDGVITWNDIHHKTSMDGGPTRFGYPDPTYLSRVREELASKGVTEQPLNKRDKAKKGGHLDF